MNATPHTLDAADGHRPGDPDGHVGYGAVLVPLDGSPLGDRALAPAAWLADRIGAEMHVVSAIRHPEAGWYDRYLGNLVTRWPGTTAHRLDGRDAAAAIVATATDLAPALVCMATHGWSRGAGFVGSTFTAVAAGLDTPLVAVGPQARLPGHVGAGRIVACVDGTPESERALPDALAWARSLGWRLSIVTVAEPTVPPLLPGAHRIRAHGPDDPDRYLERLLTRDDLAAAGADGEVVWDPISLHDGLRTHLERRPASLLALATHARRGATRALFGSRGAAIIHESPVPALVRPLHPTDR